MELGDTNLNDQSINQNNMAKKSYFLISSCGLSSILLFQSFNDRFRNEFEKQQGLRKIYGS